MIDDFSTLPIRERKGTMLLRSDYNEYDLRKVRVSNWSQDNESYPKDYDVKFDRPWNLRWSTYNHMSDLEVPSSGGPHFSQWSKMGPMPRTTTQSLHDDLLLKHMYVDRAELKPDSKAISADSRLDGDLVREVTGKRLIDVNKFFDSTTYGDDYLYMGKKWVPNNISAEEQRAINEAQVIKDLKRSRAYKDNISQFTEKYFDKRFGRNTWHDETGVYAKSLYKRLNTVQFNPLTNLAEV